MRSLGVYQAGSPSKVATVEKAVADARKRDLCETCRKLANNLVEELLPFSRLPATSVSGRGAAKLLSTVEAIKASHYSEVHVNEIDRLATNAMNVTPGRFSNPPTAAVVRPEAVLQEPKAK